MKYIQSHDENWIEGRGYRKQILLREESLNCPGTLVQLVVIEPYAKVPFHHHKKMTEVFHVLEGTGSMVIGGQTFELKPGDTLTTEPNESHNAMNSSDVPLKYIVFKTNVVEGDSYWPTDNIIESDQ